MASKRIDLPQGTLDLLILKTVSLEPQHGWAISERLQQLSTGVVQVQQGSLYPALHRLERRGWIKARWAPSDNNRNAKYLRADARRAAAARGGYGRMATAVADDRPDPRYRVRRRDMFSDLRYRVRAIVPA